MNMREDWLNCMLASASALAALAEISGD
jgi:hypothetical protein